MLWREEIYKSLCAQGHGQLEGGRAHWEHPSTLRLRNCPDDPPRIRSRSCLGIIKRGIWDTSMPAWVNLLSDEDISPVVEFLKTLETRIPAANVTASKDKPESDQHKDNWAPPTDVVDPVQAHSDNPPHCMRAYLKRSASVCRFTEKQSGHGACCVGIERAAQARRLEQREEKCQRG